MHFEITRTIVKINYARTDEGFEIYQETLAEC